MHSEIDTITQTELNSGLADAAATALFVAGPEHWHGLAKKLGLTQVLLIDNTGKIHVSPKMEQRLRLNTKIATTLIVSPPL